MVFNKSINDEIYIYDMIADLALTRVCEFSEILFFPPQRGTESSGD